MITHKALVVVLVNYSVVCLSAPTAVEGHQSRRNGSQWENKGETLLALLASQRGAFRFLNGNSSTPDVLWGNHVTQHLL